MPSSSLTRGKLDSHASPVSCCRLGSLESHSPVVDASDRVVVLESCRDEHSDAIQLLAGLSGGGMKTIDPCDFMESVCA